MSLPRGIQELKRTNKDGSVVVRYRVQINKKDFKADRLFDDKQEAIEYLLVSKSYTGKAKIKLLEQQKKEEMKIYENYVNNPPFSVYIENYLTRYVNDKYENCDPDTREGKIKLRNWKSTKSFFNTIENTLIPERSNEEFPISGLFFKGDFGKKKFGDFKPLQITDTEINEYIIARLKQGIKPVSVQRELSQISNVFKKLKHMDYKLKTLPNPCLTYDRDLLKDSSGSSKKKAYRLSDDDREKLFNALDVYPNPELGQIIKLMLFTAMRRSEAVLLKWSEVNDKYIELDGSRTKNGEARSIYLIPQAQELLNSIPKRPNDDNVFTYTVLGFQGSFDKLMERLNLTTKTHGLRKESISNFIEQIGIGHSLLIAEFLGFGVKTIEKRIEESKPAGQFNTQAEALKAFAHKSPVITQRHYFSLKK